MPMARESSDREDLLREATALVQRVELESDELTDALVAGFRRDGCLSLYFGADSVYQFNSQGRLRRAFAKDQLYKAEQGHLIRLERALSSAATTLVRYELSQAEEQSFLDHARDRLRRLTNLLERRQFRIVGQVPAAADITGRLQQALALLGEMRIADSPHAC
ncbi:MAG: hypothetical protein KDA42_02805 [Planctomycetales bacterium]|nr:hypothetical protein [Planctomycetales bacterium]